MKAKFPIGLQFLISIIVVCVVAGIGYFTQDYFGYRSVALLLLLAVSVLAMLFRIWPVLLGACMSALIWDFFFIPPKFQLRVNSAEDLLLLLMYFAIVMLSAVLTNKLRQIEKQNRQREEREKSIGLYNTLLNSLSHELRTPIATIVGAADTLRESKNLTDKNKTILIDEISKASLRLDRQVANLLNMSRLESGIIACRPDWTDVSEFLHNIVNKLEKDLSIQEINLEDRIQISFKQVLPLIKLDAGLIEQAVYNILNNAITYTPGGTAITVLAETENFMEREHSTGLEFMRHYLILKIADSGPGFPSDKIYRVFEKFFRVDTNKSGGTGLGLSIAKGFVEAHRGKIYVRNRDGGGAEFELRIPVDISNVNKMKHE